MTLPSTANARRTDPITSQEAAAAANLTLRDSQIRVLTALSYQTEPIDDTQIVNLPMLAGMTDSSIRSRRSELKRAGLVRDSGQKRELASGRRAIRWEITEHGREFLRSLL